MSSWPACWVGVIASRTEATQELAAGPDALVVVEVEDDVFFEDGDEGEAVAEVDRLVEEVPEEVLEEVLEVGLDASSPESEPHPTRVSAATAAVARVRWVARRGMLCRLPGAGEGDVIPGLRPRPAARRGPPGCRRRG
ncbi:MAG: hypothetical protein C0493_00330 [Kytococcus sp.]|nr:hypothetical protein [Kytococcus sp.]